MQDVTDVQYYNRKTFQTITENTRFIDTNCTSIQFWNKGTSRVTLICEGTRLELEPGEIITHNNQPNVREVTVYDDILFDGAGINKLFITRENITTAKPSRNTLNM